MTPRFDHEKLHVYQAGIKFVAWSTELALQVQARVAVKDHLDRASTSALRVGEEAGEYLSGEREKEHEQEQEST